MEYKAIRDHKHYYLILHHSLKTSISTKYFLPMIMKTIQVVRPFYKKRTMCPYILMKCRWKLRQKKRHIPYIAKYFGEKESHFKRNPKEINLHQEQRHEIYIKHH